LIDDEALVREAVAEMLRVLGHAVEEAGDGAEAVRRLEAGESFDLVLSDLTMPGMSGWDLIRRVRADWPGLRVAIITGTPGTLVAHRDVEQILLKPVTLAELRQAFPLSDASAGMRNATDAKGDGTSRG